ncbi:MAG: SRPBCC family protein [Haloarculaceae archaeon]
MDEVEVSTVVYAAPEEVYEFLMDFPNYASYSEHLTDVRRDGDGGPGTTYDITVSWWKLSHTVRSQVTDVDPPRRSDWRLVRDLDAQGYWGIEPVPEAAPADAETATRVRLRMNFRPDSANTSALNLPRFVPLGAVVERAKPVIQREAEKIVERLVADLEGEPRPVEIEVHARPDSV